MEIQQVKHRTQEVGGPSREVITGRSVSDRMRYSVRTSVDMSHSRENMLFTVAQICHMISNDLSYDLTVLVTVQCDTGIITAQ